MASAHSNGDFGVLGPKGCGKTAIIEEFAKKFGYATETMVMYQVGRALFTWLLSSNF